MEIYVDKKMVLTEDLAREAVETVKRYGMLEKASWINVGPAEVARIRTYDPEARCGTLSHPSASLVEDYASLNIGRGFFFNGDAKNGMTAEAIQLGLNAGFDVEVWYVDYGTATDEQVFDVLRNAVSYGVTAITTDHFRVDEAFNYLLDQYE